MHAAERSLDYGPVAEQRVWKPLRDDGSAQKSASGPADLFGSRGRSVGGADVTLLDAV